MRLITAGHDDKALAVTDTHPNGPAVLTILDVNTGSETVIKSGLDGEKHLSSQCWSPDDRSFVFQNGDSGHIYNRDQRSISDIDSGQVFTWSPDGQMIAYQKKDGIYGRPVAGGPEKRIVARKGITSGFFWSPDGRFGAYVSPASRREAGLIFDVETYSLRVRRLADGQETSVCVGGACCIGYQGTRSKRLLDRMSHSSPQK